MPASSLPPWRKENFSSVRRRGNGEGSHNFPLSKRRPKRRNPKGGSARGRGQRRVLRHPPRPHLRHRPRVSPPSWSEAPCVPGEDDPPPPGSWVALAQSPGSGRGEGSSGRASGILALPCGLTPSTKRFNYVKRRMSFHSFPNEVQLQLCQTTIYREAGKTTISDNLNSHFLVFITFLLCFCFSEFDFSIYLMF
ncbi:uncharacterized protein LOC144616074 [Panthera onca]